MSSNANGNNQSEDLSMIRDFEEVTEKIVDHERVHKRKDEEMERIFKEKITFVEKKLEREKLLLLEFINLIVLSFQTKKGFNFEFGTNFSNSLNQIYSKYKIELTEDSQTDFRYVFESLRETLLHLEVQVKEVISEKNKFELQIQDYKSKLEFEIRNQGIFESEINDNVPKLGMYNSNEVDMSVEPNEINQLDLFSDKDEESIRMRYDQIPNRKETEKGAAEVEDKLSKELKSIFTNGHYKWTQNQLAKQLESIVSLLDELKNEQRNEAQSEMDVSEISEIDNGLNQIEDVIKYLQTIQRSMDKMESFGELDVNQSEDSIKKTKPRNKFKNELIDLKSAFKKTKVENPSAKIEHLIGNNNARLLIDLFCDKLSVDRKEFNESSENEDAFIINLKRELNSVLDFNADFTNNCQKLHELWYQGLLSFVNMSGRFLLLVLNVLNKLLEWDSSFNPFVKKLKTLHFKIVEEFKEKAFKLKITNPHVLFASQENRERYFEGLKKDYVFLEEVVIESTDDLLKLLV